MADKVEVWLKDLGNGQFDVLGSDPPGKPSEPLNVILYKITIPFSPGVSFSNGGARLQSPGTRRDQGDLIINLKKDANGDLVALGSGSAGNSGATHELILPGLKNNKPGQINVAKFKKT